MSIKLIPPGKRRTGTANENKVFYAVVTVRGKRREVSTHTRDKGFAKRFAERVEAAMYERDVLGSGAPKTLAEAIEDYTAFRRPGKNDRRYLDLLRRWAGQTKLNDIGQGDFDRAAQALYPNRSADTWNRQVYTPLQTVLGHAGVSIKLRRPKQKKPRNKAVTRHTAGLLIANADDPDLKALLAVLFYSGCRIGEAIALTWARVDMPGRRICFDVGKTDKDSWRPMHARVFVELANLPPRKRVFRWSTTSGPRKPLNALCKRLGVHFTPHMARHSFATWLTDEGVSLKDVMDAGGWEDHKSVLRYTGSNVERVRKAVDKL